MISMPTPRKTWAIPILLLYLLLSGCARTNTQNVPEAPQVRVARYCEAGAVSASIAADVLIELQKAGKVTPATFEEVRAYIKTANAVFRDVTMETASADTWPVMRVKIGTIAARAVVSRAVSDPALNTQIQGIVTAVQGILGVVQ